MQGGATVDELGRRPWEPQIAFDQNQVHKSVTVTSFSQNAVQG
jgi:cytochrome bd-type quinol oxidase subunit 1